MLAGDGEFQGAPLEKMLRLHQRYPKTVLESPGTAGEKEGGAPGTPWDSDIEAGHQQN